MSKWLYRLESKTPERGLWYNLKNEYVFNVGEIDNCISKDYPMGYDERYHKGGRCWFSSCSNKKDILHWFSRENAVDLLNKGFVFAKYLATEYIEYENETTFIIETSLKREELSIEDIYN